jgi:hypothetical protein
MPKRQGLLLSDVSEGERKRRSAARPFAMKPLAGMMFALATAIVALEFGF